jgi:soluble lytic murein transglycosylase
MRIPVQAACVLTVTVLLITAPVVSAKTAVPERDKAFLAAHEAFVTGDKVKLARQAPQAKGHDLELYVHFWDLRLRLADADPAEIVSFLAVNEGTAPADQLRREWLRLLGKNGQWEQFRQQRPALVRDDAEVACYTLQMRRAEAPGAVSAAALKPYWTSARQLPAGCAAVADGMLLTGELTQRDLRERFRLLVHANLITEARLVLERLPADQVPPRTQLDDAVRDPAGFLERAPFDLATAARREAAIVALLRQAKNDPLIAARHWKALAKESFASEDRQAVWALLAVQGALRHLPEAVDWFREAGDLPLSDEQLNWRARIALRQENWPEVKLAIERMSPEGQQESVWVFWLGRSLLALGAIDEGRQLLTRIAGQHDFYGRLASEELGMPLQIPPQEKPSSQKEIDVVAGLPSFKRALQLHKFGLRTEAVQEWMWALRGMDDRSLLAAAELARRNCLWDLAINTAEKTAATHDFTMRYLAPHNEVLAKQARLRQLDESLVLGLVRQESRFIADAKSSAGAKGLMQLMPATASWAARKIGMKNFQSSRTNNPEVNATLGAFYLRHVLDELKGSPVLAAAAYNAGPLRARQWLDGKPLEGAIYIESIPFSETRQYVKKVMTNALYYAALLKGELRSLKSSLGTVTGVGSFRNGSSE